MTGAAPSTRPRIGLLGCGTVGAAVVRGLVGRDLGRVVALAVRDLERARACDLRGVAVSRSAMEVATADDVDVVVEVMGGTDVAAHTVRAALELGRPVVTANKALVANQGTSLEALAREVGTVLRYEAAVAGAVPAVATVAALARTDRITRLEGVLNGTSNFVLCAMHDQGWDLPAAVARAQQLGYAEADPGRDLDGTDAADKLAILARLAWSRGLGWARTVSTRDVAVEGIAALSRSRIVRAEERGEVWRLVASATAEGELRVEPWSVPRSHPFASVFGPDNALTVECRDSGRLTLGGPGAGGAPTASAVLRDLAAIRAETPSRAIRAQPATVG